MLKRICNLSAKVIMLQEIISGTIFVLFFGVISSKKIICKDKICNYYLR